MRLSDRAPGLVLGDEVALPDDVRLGAHVVIHDGTVLGSGCEVQDGGHALARFAQRFEILNVAHDDLIVAHARKALGVEQSQREMLAQQVQCQLPHATAWSRDQNPFAHPPIAISRRPKFNREIHEGRFSIWHVCPGADRARGND